MVREHFVTTSPRETVEKARMLASRFRRGDVVALYGDLGAGKTQFVKGVGEAFGVSTAVTSPTFVLLNRYQGHDMEGEELLIYHLDLYRVRSVEEIYDIGYEELLSGDCLCLIEWAERMDALLPANRIDVRITAGHQESHRTIEIEQFDGGADRSDSRRAGSR